MGANQITSFDDGSAEAEVADALYEDTVRNALVDTRWRFATTQTTLTASSTNPTGRWDTRWALPLDCLLVNTLTVNNGIIDYDIYEDFVYCNAVSTDTLVIDYVFRVPEARWPAWFTGLVQYTLASSFAISLARDNGLSQLMQQRMVQAQRRARHIDSMQQTTRLLDTNRLINSRLS